VAAIEGLSHMTLHVTDLTRSEGFYRDIMGLEPVGRDLVSDDGPTSLFRASSGQLLVLVEMAEVEAFRGKTTSIHHAWYLTPEQHDAAIARMKARGKDISDTREAMRAMGQKSFDVYDPDGHRYQIQTVGPEATVILKPDAGILDCGKIDDYDIGAVRLFNNGKLFVVRREHGFLALSRWCTHMNGLLQWKPNHWHFYCPYHKATFNREGASTSHTPFDTLPPMRLHPIVIDADGILKVDTDVLLIRKQADENDAVPPTPGAASDVSRYECIAGDAP
jgi:catechol 2,3-dioxygenase-like lactoylglutathione lyase family enzyme/nitrite reductase/ring-hydroxylating ferredoxin subunit